MTASIRSYQDLFAWQKAFKLGLTVCRMAPRLPDHERFGLTAQIRRNATAIASHIAHGYGRGATMDYLRLLKNARGCIYELDTQLLFAIELSYITPEDHKPVKDQLDEAERVLAGLITAIERGGSS